MASVSKFIVTLPLTAQVNMERKQSMGNFRSVVKEHFHWVLIILGWIVYTCALVAELLGYNPFVLSIISITFFSAAIGYMAVGLYRMYKDSKNR
jgi:hypothetical protein